MIQLQRTLLSMSLCALLASCGGNPGTSLNGESSGSSNRPPTPAPAPAPVPSFTYGLYEPASSFEALCASPRRGIDLFTGLAYPDSPGDSTDENNWLRSWSKDLYLWYNEIVDRNPADYLTPDYFELMKSFELSASGAAKDKFHFSLPTDEWQALAQSGVSAGYGVTFVVLASSPPRQVVVAYTEPDSPATDAGITRGVTILTVDGADLIAGVSQSDVNALNAGLFPADIGESHVFTILDLGATDPRTVTLTSKSITSTPVQNVMVLETDTGPVGYMQFNDHIATAEAQLISAILELAAAQVTDLVLDLRYNGGGFLDIASELAYMIAGPDQSVGQVFEEIQFNAKHRIFDPVTGALLQPIGFHALSQGFSTTPGEELPSLNLTRVFVLTGPGTCSASESVINSLRGIGVEVIQIGSTTCGKPYGFYPFDNCGTTYFSIQFRGINALGFGDYSDGFSPVDPPTDEGSQIPGCAVADDFTHLLGDRDEARLASALAYRNDATCPASSGLARSLASRAQQNGIVADGVVVKSAFVQNRILRR